MSSSSSSSSRDINSSVTVVGTSSVGRSVSWFFRLYDDLLSEILTEWLGLDDVVILDTAICSKLLRPQLLALLARGIVFRNESPVAVKGNFYPRWANVPAVIEWAAKRGIIFENYFNHEWHCQDDFPAMSEAVSTVFSKLVTLKCLSNCHKDAYEPFISGVLSQCFQSVREVNIFGSPRLMDKIGMCRELEKLSIGASNDITDISFMKIANLVKLKYLYISNSSKITDDATFKAIAERCVKLEELKFFRFRNNCIAPGIVHLCKTSSLRKLVLGGDMRQITDEDMDKIFRACALLSSIGLLLLNQLTDASIISMATNCRLISSINLQGLNQLTDASIISLATTCRLIEDVSLLTMPLITNAAIESLAFNCPLKAVNLDEVGVDDGGIKEVVKSCSRLERLHLPCTRISEETILLAALSLPNLKTINIRVDISSTFFPKNSNDITVASSPTLFQSLNTLFFHCKQMMHARINIISSNPFRRPVFSYNLHKERLKGLEKAFPQISIDFRFWEF